MLITDIDENVDKTRKLKMNYIMKTLQRAVTLLLLIGMSLSIHSVEANDAKKVVMIVSSNGTPGGKEKPGYEFDEFSKAYSIFKANGISVDVASPTGGAVEADEFDKNKPYNAPVLADQSIMKKLNHTIKTSELQANEYDAIFVVGGKGAMFDLPKDNALQALIADVYEQQGSVAAVCHGPAALVDVKLSDGSYLVANKAINSFTNEEEQLFGKKWLGQFEFMLEDKLVERGAKFQSSDIMLSHVAVDERLVTGQNPSSTVAVATELVKSMGLTPVQNVVDIEDRTMAVIAKFLSGDHDALSVVTEKADEYHVALIGMYGFYYLKIADAPVDYENSLTLMLVAQEAINNPTLDMKIAKTQQKLGKMDEAKGTLNKLLATKPDYKPALDMLKELSI